MDAWLTEARDALARTSGIADLDLSAEDEATLLDLARIAAHDSGERTNAPLLCYLVGRAENGAGLAALADAVQRTA